MIQPLPIGEAILSVTMDNFYSFFIFFFNMTTLEKCPF